VPTSSLTADPTIGPTSTGSESLCCSARYRWTSETTMEPSPSAEATLFTDQERTSPTARSQLRSSHTGQSIQFARSDTETWCLKERYHGRRYVRGVRPKEKNRRLARRITFANDSDFLIFAQSRFCRSSSVVDALVLILEVIG